MNRKFPSLKQFWAALITALASGSSAQEIVEVKEGDVISAEVINSLIQSVANSRKGFEDEMELDGRWSCVTYDTVFDAGAGCTQSGNVLYSKTGVFDFDGINKTYQYIGTNTPLGCRNIVNQAVNNGNYQVSGGYLVIDYGLYPFKKYSDTEFVWELQDGIPASAYTVCNKEDAPPAAVNNLVATDTTAGIKLTWTDQSTNESGFRVERKAPAVSSAWATLQSLGVDVVSFTDTSPAIDETWQYRVFAYNNFGDAYTSSVVQKTHTVTSN